MKGEITYKGIRYKFKMKIYEYPGEQSGYGQVMIFYGRVFCCNSIVKRKGYRYASLLSEFEAMRKEEVLQFVKTSIVEDIAKMELLNKWS